MFGTPVGGLAFLLSVETHAQSHGLGGPFSASLLQGLSGVLLSPSRGLLVYMPIVIVSFVGAALVWRAAPTERWTLIIPLSGSS